MKIYGLKRNLPTSQTTEGSHALRPLTSSRAEFFVREWSPPSTTLKFDRVRPNLSEAIDSTTQPEMVYCDLPDLLSTMAPSVPPSLPSSSSEPVDELDASYARLKTLIDSGQGTSDEAMQCLKQIEHLSEAQARAYEDAFDAGMALKFGEADDLLEQIDRDFGHLR